MPEATARLVNAVHGWGGRVIAVGTTVVRALETVAAPDGTVVAGRGLDRLVVTPERGLRAVDGLITGWHEPQASHLLLLEAAAGDGAARALATPRRSSAATSGTSSATPSSCFPDVRPSVGVPGVDPPLRVRHAASRAEAQEGLHVERHAAELDVEAA